jgi:RNase P subunit RPR2
MNGSLIVRCEECGCRMRLEREILWPRNVHVICHGCEAPLIVTADKLVEWAKAHPVAA